MTTTVVIRPIQPATVVQTPITTVVAVPPAPQHVTRPQAPTTTIIAPSTAVVVDPMVREQIQVGQQGMRGPQGIQGEPGSITGTTDQLAEGAINRYYTDARAALAAPVQSVNALTGDVVLDAEDVGADPIGTAIAAADAAVALHTLHPDPHSQYIDANDVVDGGNF